MNGDGKRKNSLWDFPIFPLLIPEVIFAFCDIILSFYDNILSF